MTRVMLTRGRAVEILRAQNRFRFEGREFFERNLHMDNLNAYYLRSCLDRLKG